MINFNTVIVIYRILIIFLLHSFPMFCVKSDLADIFLN